MRCKGFDGNWMDQESNSKSGSRGSWRDRLGITDDGTSKSEAGSSSAAAPSTKPAPVGGPKVVAKPAPMAPRPGAAAKAPVRAAPATADQATSPAKPKPEAERPQAAAGQKDDAFAERLRQHRAAAEEAVKKRSASPGLEKFSFAKKGSRDRPRGVCPVQQACFAKPASACKQGRCPCRQTGSTCADGRIITGTDWFSRSTPVGTTATTGSVAAGAGTRCRRRSKTGPIWRAAVFAWPAITRTAVARSAITRSAIPWPASLQATAAAFTCLQARRPGIRSAIWPAPAATARLCTPGCRSLWAWRLPGTKAAGSTGTTGSAGSTGAGTTLRTACQ